MLYTICGENLFDNGGQKLFLDFKAGHWDINFVSICRMIVPVASYADIWQGALLESLSRWFKPLPNSQNRRVPPVFPTIELRTGPHGNHIPLSCVLPQFCFSAKCSPQVHHRSPRAKLITMADENYGPVFVCPDFEFNELKILAGN